MRSSPGCLHKINKFRLTAILVLMTVIFSLGNKSFSQQEGLSKEEIVGIAIKAFEEKEGKITERVILYDVANGKWKAKFKTISEALAEKFVVLEDTDYQAVCLSIKPKPGLKGKNTWIFIDRSTGEVLAIYVE